MLVRYRFPGKRLLDAAVDLPFALPTAVAGIALAAIYAPNGWVGALLRRSASRSPIRPPAVVVALIFVGLPFVVRTVQPVLAESEKEIEEAAALLGASRLRTVFSVVLPLVLPALLTGFALAFARGIGEYGSVIFIAGNLPLVSEIAPLLIVIRLEEFDYAGAAVDRDCDAGAFLHAADADQHDCRTATAGGSVMSEIAARRPAAAQRKGGRRDAPGALSR